MATSPPNPGFSASQPGPSQAVPPVPGSASAAKVELPAPWPRAAQRVSVGLLVLAIALIAWRAIQDSRWAARPTTLAAGIGLFRVELNHADRAALLQLPGVGDALAGRIEEYRRLHGYFRSIEDLCGVNGIGPATLERLRPFVYVEAIELATEDVETPAEAPPRSKKASGGKPSLRKSEALTERIDLNRASAEELQRLPGVGPSLSARIIAAREEKPFRAVEDLRRVHGVGSKTLERLRPLVRVGSDPALRME